MQIRIQVELECRSTTPGPAFLAVEAAGAFGQEISNVSIDFGRVEHLARVPGEEGIGEKIIIRTASQIVSVTPRRMSAQTGPAAHPVASPGC